MKDPMEQLDKLAALARQEEAPEGDVSANVLRAIRTAKQSLRKPMLVFATSYAAITLVLVTVYGGTLYESVADPLSTVFEMASGMMQ